MIKEELFDLPIKHRLYVFNYVNLIYSALSNSDSSFKNEDKVKAIDSFLDESLPHRPRAFSNFVVGQTHISAIYDLILFDLDPVEQLEYSFNLATHCPSNRYRLLEQLIKVNPTLVKGLEELANFYKLINPIHYLMIKPDRISLYTKYPQLSYDLASLFFEFSWILKTLERSFQLKEKKFDQLEFGEKFISLPLNRNEFKLKSSRPEKNLQKILQRQAHDTLKQLFGFDSSSILNERLAVAVKFMLENIQGKQLPIKEMAQSLGLSERTLQRRLESHDLSFTELIQFMKFEMAKQMLEVPIFKVTDIAQGLGYSESSAFTRAFKKNEGISPLKYRKQFINRL